MTANNPTTSDNEEPACAPGPRPYPLILVMMGGFAGALQVLTGLRYLALLTGHDAPARSAGLALVLGGIVVGGKVGFLRPKDPPGLLRVLALVHGAAGLLALLFHEASAGVPALISSEPARWVVACGLALPPSILLGAAFSLSGSARARGSLATSGRAIGAFYAAGGLGAAAGAFSTGFWLSGNLGLPGSMALTGLVHSLVAMACVGLSRGEAASNPVAAVPVRVPIGRTRAALLAECSTGLALSFCLVAWARMLRLVAGGSPGDLDSALSTLLGGLALGAFLVGRRLDAIPIADADRLGRTALAGAGLAALATLPLYQGMFAVMGRLVRNVAHNDAGFSIVRISGYTMGALVVVPAATLVGLALPALTRSRALRGDGERAIGNSLVGLLSGAIPGAIAAVHVGMPRAGAKSVVVAASLVLLVPALASLASSARRAGRGGVPSWSLPAGVALAALVAGAAPFDPALTGSEVFLHGEPRLPPGSEVLFRRDGENETVHLVRDADGRIRLFGDGGAGTEANPGVGPAADDEIAAAMMVAVPLSLRPDTRVAVHTGGGSDSTTQLLLASPDLEHVDVIEMESARIEAARRLGRAVGRVFDDPRRSFHREDPLVFLTTGQSEYDLILSEPTVVSAGSRPSGLSKEFYAGAAARLHPDGLLVQRIDLEQIDPVYLASVFKGLVFSFSDYVVYSADDETILIVAGEHPIPADPDPGIFGRPKMRRALERSGLRGIADLRVRRLGSRAVLHPLFSFRAIPAHSEYFPRLAVRAVRTRFLRWDATHLTRLHGSPVPILEMLDPAGGAVSESVTECSHFAPSRARATAEALVRLINRSNDGARRATREARVFADPFLELHRNACAGGMHDDAPMIRALLALAAGTSPYVRGEPIERMWAGLDCPGLSPVVREWHRLHTAVARRDSARMLEHALTLFDGAPEQWSPAEVDYIATAGIVGALAERNQEGARELLIRLRFNRPDLDDIPVHLRLALYHLSLRRDRGEVSTAD